MIYQAKGEEYGQAKVRRPIPNNRWI
jgi:hypothetical protein